MVYARLKTNGADMPSTTIEGHYQFLGFFYTYYKFELPNVACKPSWFLPPLILSLPYFLSPYPTSPNFHVNEIEIEGEELERAVEAGPWKFCCNRSRGRVIRG
ncbi:hypothetical protein EUGRSUZ_F01134 [Eucalyptus grandis]|uniref:Uncharacterized protein n=2 Tax=Eucalyptus grandis TaxID=71139 RepID=A0ACC3KE01_EUCGR|nr:hypothetical protein EUGRSUZ_F01134 [Eucalyptus grandis]